MSEELSPGTPDASDDEAAAASDSDSDVASEYKRVDVQMSEEFREFRGEEGQLVRIESDEEVRHYEGAANVERLVRIEYDDDNVKHYDGAKDEERLVRIVDSDGDVWHYEGAKDAERLVRVEFAGGHECHGEVQHYKGAMDAERKVKTVFPDCTVQRYKGPKGNEKPDGPRQKPTPKGEKKRKAAGAAEDGKGNKSRKSQQPTGSPPPPRANPPVPTPETTRPQAAAAQAAAASSSSAAAPSLPLAAPSPAPNTANVLAPAASAPATATASGSTAPVNPSVFDFEVGRSHIERLKITLNKEVVGNDDFKALMIKIPSDMNYDKCRGQECSAPGDHSLALYGNPGTGKSSLAERLYNTLKVMGFLTGAFVKVSAKDMQVNVEEIYDSADCGMLFIDEAYGLEKSPATTNQLVDLMKKEGGDVMVVVAGYHKQMRAWFETNPGLDNRFKEQLLIKNYTADELMQIADLRLRAKGWTLSGDDDAPDGALGEARAELKEAAQYIASRSRSGNADHILQVLDKALSSFKLRCVAPGCDGEVLTAGDIAEVLDGLKKVIHEIQEPSWLQGSGGGGAGGSGDSARASDTDLYALWNAHIKPVRDCAKCETARGSPEACAAYTTEGKARGKTCMAHMKRACCLWAHSLSVAQIAAHTKSDPRFSGWKDDALRKLAKKFMQEMKGATPLGTPNEAKPKNSFQVPLYSGNPLRPVKTDGTPTNGASGSGHYWVFMGHQWQGTSPGAGSSSDS